MLKTQILAGQVSMLFIAGTAGHTVAQEPGPSFDCARAASSVEEAICGDDRLAQYDRQLADRYNAAMSAVQSLDAGRKQATSELRAIQRGWIKGRNDCWKSDDLTSCVTEAYLTRDAELVALWLLETPARVVTYICDGIIARDIAVFYFDTERPAVRLEYGDTIQIGMQTRSASGSRYSLPFGGSFWAKGNEALFATSQSEETTCLTAP